MDTLNKLHEDALAAVNDAINAQALDDIRVRYLGKKGEITAQLKSLGKLTAEERPAAGAGRRAARCQPLSLAVRQRQGRGAPSVLLLGCVVANQPA